MSDIIFYNEKCDNCGKKTPGAFLKVWRHMSNNQGVKPQFWCFDCIHGKNFHDKIKKSVTFIFLEKVGKYEPNGTGFLVSVEVEKNKATHVMHLVTAKHVVQDETGKFHNEVTVRINKRDGGSEYIPVDLRKIQIHTHMDSEVDLAVISLSLNPEIFDFRLIPEYIIPDQQIMKQLEIAEGDDVFFSGLFESHYGQMKNRPIMRFGKVALMTDEKIEWKEKEKRSRLLDLYLMECQSFGGNSGSPVFFNLLRQQGLKLDEQGSNIYLAGIIMGSFHDTKIFAVNTFLSQNVGIAAVTPSYKLHEILYSDRLKEERMNASTYVT